MVTPTYLQFMDGKTDSISKSGSRSTCTDVPIFDYVLLIFSLFPAILVSVF